MVSSERSKKWQMRGEKHVPRLKAEQDAKEDAACRQIQETVLPDPLTDATRKTRRSLLILSVLALVANARLPIDKIPYLRTQLSEESIAVSLGVISIGVVYFLVNFISSVGNEYLSWRLQGNLALLKQTREWIGGINEQANRISTMVDHVTFETEQINLKDHVEKSTEIVQELTVRLRRIENYYVSITRVQMIRVVGVEIVLPLIVASLALWKVASQVFPMIVQIITA